MVDHYGFRDLLVDHEDQAQTAAQVAQEAVSGIEVARRVTCTGSR